MKLLEIIRAQKNNVAVGGWKKGAIPKAQFPLTRAKLKLGLDWEWRLVTFEALKQEFIVLIQLNLKKEEYRAILAMKYDMTLKVICHHELHTCHFNWHCHLIEGDVHETYAGVLRDRDRMKRWPVFRSSECTVPFNPNKNNALSLAAGHYRFESNGELL